MSDTAPLEAPQTEGRQLPQDQATKESRLIYVALAITGVLMLVMIFVLVSSGRTGVGTKSDTRYDFAYRDPYTVISRTNRIIMDADVHATITAYPDRPDTIAVDEGGVHGPANATFTWVIIPQLGSGGPTQISGELVFNSQLYKMCEGIIGSTYNFPPDYNRLYAEQYFPIDNVGKRFHLPHQVNEAPFVDFMRTAIADTASFTGDGSLPNKQLREMAGDLTQACVASPTDARLNP